MVKTNRSLYQKKVKLTVHGRRTKWAPFWTVVKKFGKGKKVHPSYMTRIRSDNIKWGIKHRVANGTSKLYTRKCYGYLNDKDGELVIFDDQAKIVKMVFEWYLQGKSIIGIVKDLERRGVKSPTGKDTWSKRTVDTMLSNEKYAGNVMLLGNGHYSECYLSKENNPAIISEATFKAVQLEKARRSNVFMDENVVKRKSTKYSSKNIK